MMTYLTACRDWQLPVLLESMRRWCRPFHLYVLAWDWSRPSDEDLTVITREQFLVAHPEYRRLPGPPRQTINYIDAFRWRVATDLIRGGRGPVLHLDGDQFIFSSPAPLFEEIGASPMAVSPHRFARAADGLPGVTEESHGRYAKYNSGLLYLADPEIGERLARSCYEWSYSDVVPLPQGGCLFGDQGHVERIADHVGAHVIQTVAANLAPWNCNRHQLEDRNGLVLVDGIPLISYHFSSLRLKDDGSIAQYADANYCLPEAYIRMIYGPYIEEIKRCS